VSLKKANHTTAPHGAVVGIVPAAAGEEATTTQSQSIAAPKTHPRTPSRVDATTNSAGTIVPAEFRFTETQYEPTDNVTGEELSTLSQDDLLTGLKKQYSRTRNSHAQFGRDLAALVAFYDAVVARYSNERVSKGRNGDPTLREAFFAVGWNYEAARKMKQRYNASIAALPSYAPAPKPLRLAEGDKVKAGDGTEGTVENVHESAAKVDVVFKGRDEIVTIPVAELAKVVIPVKKIRVGDLILCDDVGAEYKYEGHGKFSRTKAPTLLEQKRERELATIKVKQEREKAKAEEKTRQQELCKAEAALRDLEKVAEKERRSAEAKAKKDAARLKKAETEAAKVKKRSKTNSATAAQKPAKTELVKMVRIGDTREFGVYPESCMEYTSSNALAIGARQVCETERDRINTKRLAKNGSPENVPEAAHALAPSASRPSNLASANNAE
jgi:hypothetical protein